MRYGTISPSYISRQSESDKAMFSDVSIQRGGMLLYDSRKTQSHINRWPVDSHFSTDILQTDNQSSTVLDLSRSMRLFRRDYYETKGNPILVYAYNDLAQRNRTKYSKSAIGWCSEFAAHVYRANGIEAPDPDFREINWFVLKDYIGRVQGKIYSLREIANWTAKEKMDRIKPGSLVSIVTGAGVSHTLLFTSWNESDGFSSFSAISGNNQGMVWAHSMIKIPMPDVWENLSGKDFISWDARSYIAVPAN